MIMAQEQSRQDQKYRLRRVDRTKRRMLSSRHKYQAIPTQAAAVIAVGNVVISLAVEVVRSMFAVESLRWSCQQVARVGIPTTIYL
jgi:ribosomal silencing factor RsfS